MARSRLSVNTLALYLIVVFLCVGLFLPRTFPGGEEAIPVLGGGGASPANRPAWMTILLIWGCPPLFTPATGGVLDPSTGHAAGLFSGGREILSGAIHALTGIRWPEPRSMMSAVMPSLLVTGEEAIPAVAVSDPVVYLPPPVAPPGDGSGDDLPRQDEEVVIPPGGADGWPPPDKPLVVIYHTHSQESFLPVMGLGPSADAEAAFSSDPAINMLAAGEMLAQILAEQHGIGVVHVLEPFDLDQHGRMQRLGAYARAETYMASLVERYPGARILIDLHRDSPRRDRTVLGHPDGDYAKILLVVGTDQRLEHPGWRQNLAYSQHLIQIMDDMVPGITRGVEPAPHRYNQHLSPAAILVELGGVDNTLDEAGRSLEVLAAAIRESILAGLVPGLEPPGN